MQFALGFCLCACVYVCVFFFFLNKTLDMAPKVGRKFKTKANRNLASSSSASPLVDRVSFLSAKNKEVYDTLTKYGSIWGKREIVLDELDPSIQVVII